MRRIPRLLLPAALAAALPLPGLAQRPTVADRAEAYAAAVRQWQGGEDRYLALDPAGLADDAKASDGADPDGRTPEIVSRLLATGLFDGVCELQPRGMRSVCPDSAPGMRVRFLPLLTAIGDTLQFEVGYSELPRPGGSTRLFYVSYAYRVARVDGVWTVVETRRRAIT